MRTKLFKSLLLAAVVAMAGGPYAGAWADGRQVTDDAGRTVTIPDQVERVVVMHEPLLGIPLMDLGLDLVGSYGRTDDGGFVIQVDFIDVVLGPGRNKPQGFGAVGQIDLEKLNALSPDLIIGTERNVDKVDQLATIAPVYLQNISTGKTYGFSVEEDLARVLRMEDAFAERRAAYDARRAEVQAKLPVDPGTQNYLAIFLTDQLNAVGEMSGMVQVLEDLGYTRMSLESDGGAGLGSTLMAPLSTEVFARLNPDLLIVMNTYTGKGRDEEGTRAALDRIVPGWDRFLKPAREGRVLFVDSAAVTTPTIASALHMLDALEEWATR